MLNELKHSIRRYRQLLTAEAVGLSVDSRSADTYWSDATSLEMYRAAREVAGNDWSRIREDLLEHLQRRSPGRETAREYAEIFLAEDMLDEAVAIAEESGHYTVVEPVVEAVCDDHPDWTIKACKDQAEPVIEQGESDRYRYAVQWLRHAGETTQAAGELNTWRDYVETLRDEHYRKYTVGLNS